MKLFKKENVNRILTILVLAIIFMQGCSSTKEAATSTASIVLDGRILYPDEEVVQDQIVNVKLETIPDTLRVGSGYFTFNVLYKGTYELVLIPQKRNYYLPPISLDIDKDGLNIYDFIIPRFVEGEIPEPGKGRDTTSIKIQGRGGIRPPNKE